MTDKPAVRTRVKPALTMNHLDDRSGGTIVDTLLGVTAFHGAPDNVAGTLSARKAFARVADGVAEIIAKAAPEIALPITVNAVIPEMGEVVGDDVGLSVEEANSARVVLNGYIETAAYLVSASAARRGVFAPFRSHVGGDFMVADGKLAAFDIQHHESARPGLGKAEMDAALARWADCLATLAMVVNAAAPEVPASPDASTAE